MDHTIGILPVLSGKSSNDIPLIQNMPKNTVDTFLQVHQMLLAMNPAKPKFYLSLAYQSVESSKWNKRQC